MLDVVRAEHFNALIGQVCRIESEDGADLTLTVERVHLRPEAQLPGTKDKREPFSVLLVAAGETGWVEGPCSLEIPGLGRLENVHMARTVPQSADLSKAYYQIMFN